MNDQCHILKPNEVFTNKGITYTPLGPFIVPIVVEDEKEKNKKKITYLI